MWAMAGYIKVSGIKRLEREMEWAFSFGLMDQSMREYGRKIKQMAKGE